MKDALVWVGKVVVICVIAEGVRRGADYAIEENKKRKTKTEKTEKA